MLLRYALVAVLLFGAACAAPATTPMMVMPTPPPPQIVHVIELERPAASSGRLKLIKKTEYSRNTIKLRPDERDYYAVVSWTAEGSIRYADHATEWVFTYSPLDIRRASSLRRPDLEVGVHGLGLQVKNRTQDIIEIDWTRTVLVDPSGRTARIIHRGIKLADRNASAAPSVIPSGAVLEDFVFPSDGIYFEPGRYGGWRTPGYFDQLRAGMRVGLTIAAKPGDRSVTKSFTFLVRDSE
ncbi:MAG: hypothetical protein HYV04_10205 [Deltaproteobacteria bacterium]|nr:hypothetical protein [Deltaproteobacteria bacterium]